MGQANEYHLNEQIFVIHVKGRNADLGVDPPHALVVGELDMLRLGEGLLLCKVLVPPVGELDLLFAHLASIYIYNMIIYIYVYRSCNGAGFMSHNVVETVKIPKGVDNGNTLRMTKKGHSSQGGPPGDLFLQVRIKPHAYFKRDQYDIHTDKWINISLVQHSILYIYIYIYLRLY